MKKLILILMFTPFVAQAGSPFCSHFFKLAYKHQKQAFLDKIGFEANTSSVLPGMSLVVPLRFDRLWAESSSKITGFRVVVRDQFDDLFYSFEHSFKEEKHLLSFKSPFLLSIPEFANTGEYTLYLEYYSNNKGLYENLVNPKGLLFKKTHRSVSKFEITYDIEKVEEEYFSNLKSRDHLTETSTESK